MTSILSISHHAQLDPSLFHTFFTLSVSHPSIPCNKSKDVFQASFAWSISHLPFDSVLMFVPLCLHLVGMMHSRGSLRTHTPAPSIATYILGTKKNRVRTQISSTFWKKRSFVKKRTRLGSELWYSVVWQLWGNLADITQ